MGDKINTSIHSPRTDAMEILNNNNESKLLIIRNNELEFMKDGAKKALFLKSMRSNKSNSNTVGQNIGKSMDIKV
jgi:hypothetical protein